MLLYERVHLQRKIMLMHQPLEDYDAILKRRGEERTRGREERRKMGRREKLAVKNHRLTDTFRRRSWRYSKFYTTVRDINII